MNSYLPSVRRTLSIVAAALAGLGASVAFATPAAAATTDPVPAITVVVEDSSCKVNGTVGVLWEITNTLGFDVTLTAADLTPAGSTSDFAPNTSLPNTQSVNVFQVVPVGAGSASLKILWEKTIGKEPTGDATGQILFEQECEATAKAEFTDNCDGTVTVKLINENPQNGVVFTVNGSDHILAPGSTKTITNVTPNAGGNVEVDVNTLPIGSHHWTEPDDCPSLVDTGTPIGGLVAIGATLVGVGATLIGLFVMLRRRANTAA